MEPTQDPQPTPAEPDAHRAANHTLTAVPGIEVGHWTSPAGTTGCTVILPPPEGFVASGVVLGGAPASRESALLAPEKMMGRIDALVLTGGSAFGLATADGVTRWLAERGRGFETQAGPVPIVPAAAIYDLEINGDRPRPDAAAGYAAAGAATAAPVPTGRVGAGAGAAAGSYLGYPQSTRTGIGCSTAQLGDVIVAALAVVNPAGDIYDPNTGELVVGHGLSGREIAPRLRGYNPGENTTLVAVATNARLTKATAAGLAVSAHAGIARVIRPSHTPFDGDTAFVLSTNEGPEVDTGPLAVLAQEVVAEAILAGTPRG